MIIGRKLKFLLLPRQCELSKKLLWLKFAYKVTHMYTGPGEPVFVYKYYNRNDYLVNRLKGSNEDI